MYTVGGNIKWCSHSGKVWQFLKKLNILQPQYPAIVFLCIYPREMKSYVYRPTCAWMFITTLFIIVKTCEQPRCPSMGEYFNTLVHPHHETLFSNYKEGNMNTKQSRWISRELHWAKNTNPKKLYDLCSHLYKILEITKSHRWTTLEIDKEGWKWV